jgi:hypothetical protein
MTGNVVACYREGVGYGYGGGARLPSSRINVPAGVPALRFFRWSQGLRP